MKWGVNIKFSFKNEEDENKLEVILAKKRKSKADKEFLKSYFKAIEEFTGTEEKKYQEKYGLDTDHITHISGFLEVRLSTLLKKDKQSEIELEELRALYSHAKWHVITTWTVTQLRETEEELKKTNLRGLSLYNAPWKWSLYWP